jgi:ADP-ribose pyrophosphatase YjhB (NUDIX family)
MFFPVTPDLRGCLLLLKPANHRNVLFRGRWTVPGGHIEPGEAPIQGAIRELEKETGIKVDPSEVRQVLSFLCNCDPNEEEHEVFVFSAAFSREVLSGAIGEPEEPVKLFSSQWLPDNLLWYVMPLS